MSDDLLKTTEPARPAKAHLYPPGGPTPTDRLLQGAIDLHHHGYPEYSFGARTRNEDIDELRLSRDMGMAAVVLKSHMWPTVGRAYLLKDMVPGIDVIPSLSLNTVSGGFNPITVESAAEQGARVMFMPTWSAANDLERGGYSRHMAHYLKRIGTLAPERGLRATGPDGRILPEVKECLAVAGEYGLLVCTGHLSPRESIVVADAAKEYGIDEIVFTHPDSLSVGAGREEIRDMVQLGAICEFCTLGMLPMLQRIHPRTAIEIVREISADRAVITTDYSNDIGPSGSEMMRMLIGTFLALGLSEGDVGKMVRTNPARLLKRSAAPCTHQPPTG